MLGARTILAPWMACVDALLGRSDAARSRLRPASELARGLPAILLSAQAAVLLESAEHAEAFYEPLTRAAPFGRFFWGPGGGFPLGPVSRILGELALLRGDEGRARSTSTPRSPSAARWGPCRSWRSARRRAPRWAANDPARPPASGRAESSLALSREGDVWAVTAGRARPSG